MSEEESLGPMPVSRVRTTELEIEGKRYVLMTQSDFRQLCEQAGGRHEDAAKFGRGPVGPDLRARRIKAHLTLTQAARRAGIRLETLSRIENGHTDPSVRTVQSILRALEGTA